jgi:hypothetical protein
MSFNSRPFLVVVLRGGRPAFDDKNSFLSPQPMNSVPRVLMMMMMRPQLKVGGNMLPNSVLSGPLDEDDQ